MTVDVHSYVPIVPHTGPAPYPARTQAQLFANTAIGGMGAPA